MRSKEEAHDYRYFPEPDLPLVKLDEGWVESLRASMPELPEARLARFREQHGLSEYDAGNLVAGRATADFFEAVVEHGAAPKRAANWITVELAGKFNSDKATLADLKFGPAELAALIAMIESGKISGKIAKTVFDAMYETGTGPAEIVAKEGLGQVSDAGELEKIVATILAENAGQVAQYKAGKVKVFGFFVGQVMKANAGQANPHLVDDLLKRKLA